MWQNFVGDVIDIIYDVITFISKYHLEIHGKIAIFADIIKILTMFLITIYKDSRKVKINRNYVFIYFLDLLWVRYNCAKFHHCTICATNFREQGPFWPLPHPWADPKKPILNRVKDPILRVAFKGLYHWWSLIWTSAKYLIKDVSPGQGLCDWKKHMLTFVVNLRLMDRKNLFS